MGWRQKCFKSGWFDGLTWGVPNPRSAGRRIAPGEDGKYYRLGYAAGATMHIAHSEARGYCTRCGLETTGDEQFCPCCGAQVRLSHKRFWSRR